MAKVVEINANYHRINIELGYKCNLNCSYCYLNKVINKHHYSTLSIERLTDIFNFIEKVNNETNFNWEILLTGGEPVLYYKEYIKLLDLMKKAELENIKVVSLITNGFIFNKNLIEKIKEIEKKEKVPIVMMSLHKLTKRWLENYKKYVYEISPYNIRIIKIVNKKNLKVSFKIAEFLIEYIKKTAKEYFKNSEEFEYFNNLFRNRLLLFINLQKDVNEFDYHFHKKYKDYLNFLLKRYSSENYIKELKLYIQKEYESFSKYGYCRILDKVNEYIKIYPDLRIGGCGFMDPFEWNPKYFKQYTIYDIIKDPTILEKSYYTDYGKALVEKYAKISYKTLKTLGYKIKYFAYCPKRALIYNKGRLGPYPLKFLKSYTLIT